MSKPTSKIAFGHHPPPSSIKVATISFAFPSHRVVVPSLSRSLRQMSSSSPPNPQPPLPPRRISDPLTPFNRQSTTIHHIPTMSSIPASKTQPTYPPPRNVFHTSSIPPVSMPPPTQHSHLTNLPVPSLPSHRDAWITNRIQDQSVSPRNYSIPPGPITAAPLLPPEHVRLLNPPEYSESLMSRIAHLEHRVRHSPYLQEILTHMSQRTAHVATGVDIDSRIHFAGRSTHENTIVAYGFPKSDVDADYCLEDTPGLSNSNFNLLKETLNSHLHRSRRCAQEMVRDLESALASQISFRALPAAEMERRVQFIVNKYGEARQQILHKFRGYVRNRRWIENVATRQRRGCLTHRQNNILRLWLFSHFSNPYPDTKDKKRLIAETKLNITQINNWLINARSRVWKPTVEIMSGERIRKEMRRKEEAFANGKARDWELAEFSMVLPNDGKLDKQEGGGSNHISHENIPSVPINPAPEAQTAVQNTSLGAAPVSQCMQGSAGGIADGSSSMVHDVGANATQHVEGLADVGGNWLVPQTFGTLEFNPDVTNQHSA